ncbi:hypothetical protein E0L36_00290 [Streptomyces sp. AJS327]|uniref:SurA N-terminal domain-containing protein n=1 Tax=Streptomyces sp. AJS327 TaxID=2545265 RepID=UPI0015DF13BE|nr:SurA N-terminal domain-containing protein [Streptomyces sp. AJS327]MBA0049407.1 hypothetical protein [Streptomyces sp. AJS327]
MERHRHRSALAPRSRGPRSPRTRALIAAPALLVAVPLLSACGDESHPGAAAVIEGDRISTAQLQSSVNAVRDAQRDAPRGEDMIKHTGQLSRATLHRMIHDEVIARAGKDAGVSVSRRDVQAARAQFASNMGGARQFEAALLREELIAPGKVDHWVRSQVTVSKLARKDGIDSGTPQGSQALARKLSKVSESMRIDVNPRYGKWDASRAVLSDRKDDWLKDRSGEEARRAQAAPS